MMYAQPVLSKPLQVLTKLVQLALTIKWLQHQIRVLLQRVQQNNMQLLAQLIAQLVLRQVLLLAT
jgi:hypothetical protein